LKERCLNTYHSPFSATAWSAHFLIVANILRNKEETMPIVRKLVVPLLLILMLFAASASASAAPLATNTHETVRQTVGWTLPADQCPTLPAGLSVSGTGERLEEINTQVNAGGGSRIIINDLVKGSAVDSNGGVYHFVYHNHSIEIVPPSGSGLPNQVSMADSFVLNGDGSAGHMSIGFNWRWTYTPPEAIWPPVHNWQQVSTRGDPLLCDPI
jgi:hypothetical protein